MEEPTCVDCSMVEPSAARISSVVSANTDKVMADDIVAIVTNIRNITTATNNQENGLIYGSSTIRPNFSGVQVDYAGSQRMPDRVPHNPQHRLGTGDERVPLLAPRTIGADRLPLTLPHFRNQHTITLCVGAGHIIPDASRQFPAVIDFRADCSGLTGPVTYSRGGS